MKYFIICIAAAAALAACGASDTSSQAQEQKPQTASIHPSAKQYASSYENVVEALYVAYFGRPADPKGLTNFEAALQAAAAPTDVGGLAQAYSSNPSIKSLIDSFGTSKESQTLYGAGSTTSFVTAVFQNVLGRAPQTSGLNFWVGQIDSGAVTVSDAALSIMAGAMSNTTAQGALDAQLVANRLSVASQYTARVMAQNSIAGYSGASAAANARNFLSSVTAATDVSGFQANIAAAVTSLESSTVRVYAGSTVSFGEIGTSNLSFVSGAVTDSQGNLYVTNTGAHIVLKISVFEDPQILAGQLAVSGDLDATGRAAAFNSPQGLAIDGNDNIYVADTGNNAIRVITPGGVVTTLAGGGAATSAAPPTLNAPGGVCVDTAGNVYVADTGNNAIRKIDPHGAVSTFAGTAGQSGSADGIGAAARFNKPTGIVIDANGTLYVTDLGNNTIRRISSAGAVTTLAGSAGNAGSSDGAGAAASFNGPWGISFDLHGNLLVADSVDYGIRRVTTSGVVTTVYPTNANGGLASGSDTGVRAIATDLRGNIFIGDNSYIYKINSSGVANVYIGMISSYGNNDGPVTTAKFFAPQGISFDANGNAYVADSANNAIRKITPEGFVSTIVSPNTGTQQGGTSQLPFGSPGALAVDGQGNIYVTDIIYQWIRKVTPDGAVTTFAGHQLDYGNVDGQGTAAYFAGPRAIVCDAAGNVYVVDGSYGLIRKITSEGMVSTLAGAANPFPSVRDGTGSNASFGNPWGITIDGSGNLYVADGNLIRKVTSTGVVTTLITTGLRANIALKGLALGPDGNFYVADSANDVIYQITPGGATSIVAGTYGINNFEIGSLPGIIASPQFLTFDPGGALYTTSGNAILKITLRQ